MAILEQFIGQQPTYVDVILGLIGFGLVWYASGVVEDSTTKLGEHFGVPPAIQGGIIAAVATSFPELAVTVLSILVLGEFGVGAGAIIGSAIFNILMIPGVAAIVSKKRPTTNRGIVYRDAIYYVAAILGFGLVLAFGVLGSPDLTTSEVTPIMAVGLLVLYVVYVFLLSLSKTTDNTGSNVRVHDGTNVTQQTGILLGGLLLILIGVESMVTMTTNIATAVGAPNFIVAVTVLSALTSFPDLLVGVQLAQDGRGEAAISNVFGSNTFNLIGALPIGVLLAGGATISFVEGVPLLLFLIFTTIVVMFLSATDFNLGPQEGYLMVALYVAFVVWMAMEGLGITDLLSGSLLPV